MMDYRKLTEPFAPAQIRWRIGSTSKDKQRGMALAYIDARDVMDRLDAVVGPQGWMDSYHETPSGRVICTLTIEGISKSDGAGETAVEGEKGAISDAFKRAAVKFGIGRYLYSVPAVWVEVDEFKKIKPKERSKLSRALLDVPVKPMTWHELETHIREVVDRHASFASYEVFEQWIAYTCQKPINDLPEGAVQRILKFLDDNPNEETWEEGKRESLKDAIDVVAKSNSEGF